MNKFLVVCLQMFITLLVLTAITLIMWKFGAIQKSDCTNQKCLHGAPRLISGVCICVEVPK